MRLPIGGVTWGNVVSAAVTVVVGAGVLWGQWVLFGYRLDETAQNVAALEIRTSKVETSIADIRLTYATAGSLHDLSADQRAALAPLQTKIDQLIDRIATVDRNQVETSTGLKALTDSVADLKRSLMGRRQPMIFEQTQAAQIPRPP